MGRFVDIVVLGDLILDVPDPDHWLSGIAPATRAADIAIGHLEVPHTLRGTELKGDVPAPGADPAHLAALARAGFRAVTLAGNHIADRGPVGIADTVDELDRLGIAHCGAGADLDAARAPALLTAPDGRRVALLSYNCVGPVAAWADAHGAGCAYVHVRSRDGAPSSPQADLVEADADSLAIMVHDIAAARRTADLVIVALHKGITHRPITLAPYERPVAHAAIQAGADVVVGHHAHISRGIEVVDGRPVYHGLGNGVVVTRALSPDQDHPARAAWAKRRREIFGFEPDPAYFLAPFHPEAVFAHAAKLRWHADGRLEAGVELFWSEPPGLPRVAAGERRAEATAYLQRITVAAGLPPLRLDDDGWIGRG